MDKSDSETTFNALVKVLNETSSNLVKYVLDGVFDMQRIRAVVGRKR